MPCLCSSAYYLMLKPYNQVRTCEVDVVAKEKTYKLVKFPPEVLQEARNAYVRCLNLKEPTFAEWSIQFRDERWEFDNEDEFLSEYRKEIIRRAHWVFAHHEKGKSYSWRFYFDLRETSLYVELPTRQDIEKVFNILEANYEKYKMPPADSKKAIRETIKVYIGHGRSPQWKDLKEHLQDKHSFKVIAYETGARAGYTITEVLERMASEASIAFLVHTGEDLDKDGKPHARENVIHETGLLQGKLGFKRAIILLEEGCNEFSNIAGMQQLRFSKNNIKEIFGDVLAIIYREFGLSIEEVGD